jgi:hypothetical protein
MPLEREIKLPVIAPGLIFNLAKRLGQFDGETHQAIRQYLCSVAPVPADAEILLDSAVETKECLDTAASVSGQVVIQLDDHDVVTDVSGPTELYFDRRSSADILGRLIGDLIPELIMTAAPCADAERDASIKVRATVL